MKPATQALNTMRAAMADGWHEESLMVDRAVEVLVAGGMDRAGAQKTAQAVFDQHFKLMVPN